MLKALLKPAEDDQPFEYVTVTTGDEVDLGGRRLRFLHTPFLHWPDTQCTYLVEEQVLFSGDVFGCHYCDSRLFNDRVGDFRFSFDYYYAHIMRPFKEHVMDALKLIEPLPLKLIAPTHGPILRDRPRRYVTHYRELSTSSLADVISNQEKSLIVFYMSSYGNTARMAEAVCAGAEEREGVRVSLRMIEDRMRGLKMRVPINGLRIKLIPTEEELAECREFGRRPSGALLGDRTESGVIELADLV
jgi:NADH oxidase (H2O-forming)